MFAWEEEEENHLLSWLVNKVPSTGSTDQWLWKADEGLVYTVSSVYICLKKTKGGVFRSLYEAFWSIKVLTSSMTTAWRVLGDRLPTCVNLEKKE